MTETDLQDGSKLLKQQTLTSATQTISGASSVVLLINISTFEKYLDPFTK